MKKQRRRARPWFARFPEFHLPEEGEMVTSMRVHDISGRSRIVYIRDEKNGYPFSREESRGEMHQLMDGRQEQ